MRRTWIVACVAATLVLAGSVVGVAPALALQPDGANGWYWQMPQPAGGIAGLSDLAFPDATDLWTVGAGGLVLHSGDAGDSWAVQTTPTQDDLWSVSFPDAQHGWACGGPLSGGAGVVVATTDGGAHWVDRTPPKLAASLTGASFVDQHHGWIGTAAGTLLHTTDGGGSWTTQRLPVAGVPPYLRMVASGVTVDGVSATRGWAAAYNEVFTTTSGGRSWFPVAAGLGRADIVFQVDFADAMHGWLLVYSVNDDSTRVLSTMDGGFLWHRVATGGAWVTGLDAAGPSDIWLLESGYSDLSGIDRFMMGFEGGGAMTVEHSTDAGAHWHAAVLGSPYTAGAVAARGSNVCAVGDGILVSHDAAATWKSATSGQEYFFTSAQAVSATDIWATDAAGALLHSTDGEHWTEQPSPMRWVNALYGVSFPDPQDGWLVGTDYDAGASSMILHTSDGGVTWTPQQSTLSGELVGVDFVDDSTGWAISDDNESEGVMAPLTIEHTTDGGATWIPQYVPNDANLFAVDFVSATTGWAAGYYYPSENSDGLPGIFRTTNGGLTWTREKVPAGAQAISGLQFVSATEGWAVATSYDQADQPQEGWVLHTTDGGHAWTRLDGLDNVLAETVDFSDAMNGWIGGLNGVWATTDGGADWSQVAGGEGVTAIAAIDATHVWAFGDGFLVSPLAGGGDTAAPVTLVDDFRNWYSKPATIGLSASDPGGAVQATSVSTDGGATWQDGAQVSFDAPVDHSNDGWHPILYRTTDTAGNREQTESLGIGIDTIGPTCSVPRRAIADAGGTGTLYFMAKDAASDVARATVSILDRRGHVVRRFVELPSPWGFGGVPYYYLRFHCNLKPGTYRVEVRAADEAGNPQVAVGRGVLKVVSNGAPRFHNPGWPAGLSTGYGGFDGGLRHNLEARRLLRLRALRSGPWRALLPRGRLE